MASKSIIDTLTPNDGSDPETATTTDATERRPAETEPPAAPTVSLDDVFEILKNQRRRQVLSYLSERGEPVSLGELSEHVAAAENAKPITHLRSQERKRVYVGLYQCHLPKMDAMGFVRFNKPRGIVELGPAAGHAASYLQHDGAAAHRWPTYYLGLVGVGWLLLLGSLALNTPATIVATGVFLTLLTVLAVAHAYTLRDAPVGPTFATPTSNA
jgi:hypothetical protein